MGYQIWYCLCLALCAYNLWILFEESRLVSFNKVHITFADAKFSFCLSIRELIDSGVFVENEIATPRQMIDKVVGSLLTGSEEHLILKTSYIRHNHVCLDFFAETFHLIFPNISFFEFKLFINPSNESEIYFFEQLYIHNRLDNARFVLSVMVVQIQFLPHPFETDCTLDGARTINSDKAVTIYKKVECLLQCYKSKLISDSTFLFYQYNEHAKMKLKRNEALAADPACEELCSPKDCFAKFYYKFLSFKRDGQNLPEIEVDYYSLVAVPFLGSYEFVIQFVSLAFLFLDLSFCQILVICGRTMKRRMLRLMPRLSQASQRLPITGLHAALALCTVLLVVQACCSIREFFDFDFFVKDYFESTKVFTPFTIFVCLPVQLAYLKETESLENTTLNEQLNQTLNKQLNRQVHPKNELLFRNKTFLEIESDTDRFFGDLIRRSHLQKGGMQIAWPVEIERETIFKAETFEKSSLLSRCLRIDVNIEELKYETNMAFTQLVIELNHSPFNVYYVDFRNHLSWTDRPIPRKIRLYVTQKFRLPHPYKSNCLHYHATHPCTERDACWDYCYNRQFYANYSSISSKSVIYKSYYKSYFDKSILSTARFSPKEDEQIRNACIATYTNRDCHKVVFEEEFEHIEFERRTINNRIVLDLYLFKGEIVLSV